MTNGENSITSMNKISTRVVANHIEVKNTRIFGRIGSCSIFPNPHYRSRPNLLSIPQSKVTVIGIENTHAHALGQNGVTLHTAFRMDSTTPSETLNDALKAAEKQLPSDYIQQKFVKNNDH